MKYPEWYNYQLLLKSITVPKIKLSKLLEIRAAIPYPGFVSTASNKQTYNHGDESFISILDYP